MGAIKMEMKDDPCSDNINKGQLIYRNDKKSRVGNTWIIMGKETKNTPYVIPI